MSDRAPRVLVRAGRVAGLAGVCLAILALGAWRAPSSAVTTVGSPSHPTSVRDSPGWYPTVDPESTSVLLGRRLGAPAVSRRFHGGVRSLDDLGRAVCYALHHESKDSLWALCVTDVEFRDILWREMPESRPVTGLQWQDAWTILYARIHSGCSGAVSDFGGHYYEFVRFESDTTFRFRNFNLHRRLTLVARDDHGDTVRMRWLRSVAERKGSFKIYSTDD